MLISQVTEGIISDLRRLGELGDEQLQRAVALMSSTIEPSLRGRILEVLNVVASELNASAGPAQVELRLAGDDVALTWRDVVAESFEPPSDLNARVALRLPDDAKSKIEEHASNEGLSVNAWIVRSLQLAVDRTSSSVVARSRRQMRGTGKS